MKSVRKVTKIDEDTAGVASHLLQGQRRQDAAQRGDEDVDDQRHAHGDRQTPVVVEQERRQAHDDGQRHPVHQAHQHLAHDDPAGVGGGQLLARQGADGHGQGLGAGVAAQGRDDRHQHGQGHQLGDLILEDGDGRDGDGLGHEIEQQPRQPRADDLLNAGVAAGVGHAGQGQDVLLGLVADDLDDVVDGDLPHQTAARIDDRRADQVVLVEDVGDLFLVHADIDFGRRLHQLGQRRLAAAAQQDADRDRAHRLEGRIDHVDVEEQLGQLVAGVADVINRLADGPEFRRGQELALHQAAGGLVLVGQRRLDGRAIGLAHGRQHLEALGFVQVVDDVGGVVGVQFLQRSGQGHRRRGLQHFLAQVLVHLRDDLAQRLGVEQRDHVLAVVGGQEAHQVGDVGRLQRRHQLAQALQVAAVDGVDHHVDIVGIEGVVVAQGQVFQLLGRLGLGQRNVVQRLFGQFGGVPGHGGLLSSWSVGFVAVVR